MCGEAFGCVLVCVPWLACAEGRSALEPAKGEIPGSIAAHAAAPPAGAGAASAGAASAGAASAGAASSAPPPAAAPNAADAAGEGSPEAGAPSSSAACPPERRRRRSLWVQFDDPFAPKGSKEAANAAITIDGRVVLEVRLREQGNPMVHRHWGHATVELELCEAQVTFGLRVDPLGLRDERPLDLSRGAYLVLTYERAGRVGVRQYRTRPLYR